jgi:hypothetical protein
MPAAAPADDAAPAIEPSPADKAARCATCDERFVPRDGQLLCDACLVLETQRRTKRAGYTRCLVTEPVVAVGMLDDGSFRTSFGTGDVAEFADYDVLSLPEILTPAE